MFMKIFNKFIKIPIQHILIKKIVYNTPKQYQFYITEFKKSKNMWVCNVMYM